MNKTNNNIKKDDKPLKFERIYEDEETISIWKYDYSITRNGPVSVEIKYKRGHEPKPTKGKKTLKDHIADEKKKSKKKGT